MSSLSLIRHMRPYMLAAALWGALLLLIVLALSLAVFLRDGGSLSSFNLWLDWLALALAFVVICFHPLAWLDALRRLASPEALLVFALTPYVFVPVVGYWFACRERSKG